MVTTPRRRRATRVLGGADVQGWRFGPRRKNQLNKRRLGHDSVVKAAYADGLICISTEVAMETDVAVALLTAITSLIVAGLTAYWAAREAGRSRLAQERLKVVEHELARQAKQEERDLARADQLAKFREPLADAAEGFAHRLGNIVDDGFLLYLATDRQQEAIRTTAYRAARYFAALEHIYGGLNYLAFEEAERTRAVASLLAEIGKTFANDKLDRTNAADFRTSRFMIWREEQRAMGETALSDGEGPNRLLGYVAFIDRLDGGAWRWFARFASDLEAGGAEESQRFARLRTLLDELVEAIDIEGRLSKASGETP
jgi:hypothetical protein